jgi:phage terminase large subunit
MIATKTKTREVEGFKVTTAIRKLRKLKARTRIIPGGTSAGKTFGILPILIDAAIKRKGLSVSVVSETIPHLKKGAIKDFKNIMKSTGRWQEGRYNISDRVYTFANGSFIEFFSADSEGRVRGPRRDVLYINEANNIDFETYYQLAIRTALEIWLDYNPSKEFWAVTEIEDDEDVERLTLTYKDNEALAPAIVKEIEKNRAKAFFNPNLEGLELFNEANIKNAYRANWWKVYGLGLQGVLEGVIFQNWKQVHGVPAGAKLLGYGQDFGFSSDPAALLAVYEFNGAIVLDELVYLKGLINADLAKEYRRLGVKPGVSIWADAAEPKSIKELSGYGFRIAAADKGRDSINFGIDLLQGYEMLVTSSSLNLIKELRNYTWLKDKKTGKPTNEPIGKDNHLIDALRYFAVMMLSNYTPNYKGATHGKTKLKKTKGEIYKDFL